MNKHKSNKIKENSNTVRHLIMGQITTTQNIVAIKEVRHAGQQKYVLVYQRSQAYLDMHVGDIIPWHTNVFKGSP